MTLKSLAKIFKKNNKRGELVVLMPPYLMKRKGGWREDGKCSLNPKMDGENLEQKGTR
jgi:hypothetical protein